MMRICETCGNTYDKAFEIRIEGVAHVFDSFACAIQKVAPRCAHCQVPILNQGVEVRGAYFCCDHCAKQGSHS